jgi:hypothetical protein
VSRCRPVIAERLLCTCWLEHDHSKAVERFLTYEKEQSRLDLQDSACECMVANEHCAIKGPRDIYRQLDNEFRVARCPMLLLLLLQSATLSCVRWA